MDWKILALGGIAAYFLFTQKTANAASSNNGAIGSGTTAGTLAQTSRPSQNGGGWTPQTASSAPTVNSAPNNAGAVAWNNYWMQHLAGTTAPAGASAQQVAQAQLQAGYAAAAIGTPAPVPVYTPSYIASLPSSQATANGGAYQSGNGGYNIGTAALAALQGTF